MGGGGVCTVVCVTSALSELSVNQNNSPAWAISGCRNTERRLRYNTGAQLEFHHTVQSFATAAVGALSCVFIFMLLFWGFFCSVVVLVIAQRCSNIKISWYDNTSLANPQYDTYSNQKRPLKAMNFEWKSAVGVQYYYTFFHSALLWL